MKFKAWEGTFVNRFSIGMVLGTLVCFVGLLLMNEVVLWIGAGFAVLSGAPLFCLGCGETLSGGQPLPRDK
ncbi:hypothetical protein A3F39_02450 [Candidatus Berkelbacteria bacterium RIFCSPHIGHO2_12_FULL_50_11]|nr:MAG: hypothetical protein A3F39_02450 [Candidatus Berkelbacteria bacterium RIFCSPHIGHO2_12_FULL_50_11]